MTTGLRHFLGLVVGMLIAPVVAAGLAWAPNWTAEAGLDYDLTAVPGVPDWLVPTAVLAVLGVLLSLLTSSRLSPLAALVPGLLIAALGVAETAALPLPVPLLPDLLNGEAGADPWFARGPVFVAVGAVLLFSALFPSRWRRRVRDGDTDFEGPYSDYAPGHDDAGWHASPAEPSRGSAGAPDTESAPTMSWDADGMPPRYHVPESTGPQHSAGWNEPRRPDHRAGGQSDYARPPRWEERGTGP